MLVTEVEQNDPFCPIAVRVLEREIHFGSLSVLYAQRAQSRPPVLPPAQENRRAPDLSYVQSGSL
jgi:hypothetical protein